MKEEMIQTIEKLVEASHAGAIGFGELVMKLHVAGVESYLADYRARRTTYYTGDGATHTIALNTTMEQVPLSFDAPAIQSAIRQSQQGELKYPAFLRLSHAAGCVGYFVWISGRHVAYYGRQGEVHLERFPD